MTKQFDNIEFKDGDALLVIDTQIDFCPGGALPVNNGDAVVPVLNRWISGAREAGIPVFASRDWHPVDHLSFSEQGGRWPPHCIQDTEGAAFHPDLELPEDAVKITKGVRFDQDQYSVFDQTGLAERLRGDDIQRLFVGGLAQDVCVRASVLSALEEGFDVVLIEDATKPVDAENGDKALEEMADAGAEILGEKV